jgi:hypothetical protein
MTSLTLRFGLLRSAQTVHAMARRTIRGFHFGARQDQQAMFAGGVFLLFSRVTCAAQRGNFVRRRYSVRRGRACGTAVLDAWSMTGIATDSLLKVRMLLEIGELLRVAGRAELVRFLGTQRQRQQ